MTRRTALRHVFRGSHLPATALALAGMAAPLSPTVAADFSPAAIRPVGHTRCDSCDGCAPVRGSRPNARRTLGRLFGPERYCTGCGSAPGHCEMVRSAAPARVITVRPQPLPTHAEVYSPPAIAPAAVPQPLPHSLPPLASPDPLDCPPAAEPAETFEMPVPAATAPTAEPAASVPDAAPTAPAAPGEKPPGVPPARDAESLPQADEAGPKLGDPPAAASDPDVPPVPAKAMEEAGEKPPTGDANASNASEAPATSKDTDAEGTGKRPDGNKSAPQSEVPAERAEDAAESTIWLPSDGWRSSDEPTRTAGRYFQDEADLYRPAYGPGKPFGLGN